MEFSLSDIQGKVIDDFDIMEQFSSGGFSQVHFARHIPTNSFCAVKIIDLSVQSNSSFVGIMREISIFMQVSHPNISTFYRYSYREPLLLFFMEYSPNGTLMSHVKETNGLAEKEARRLFLQLFSVLRHLHTFHFLVHRDLKLENVLMDKYNNIKLIDFGLASTFYNNSMRTIVGSPGYQPPEIISGREYGEKCDVWSLGIVLYAMLTSFLPFPIQTYDAKSLINQANEFKPPTNVSVQCGDLMKKMLQGNPDNRPTLLQLQSHPWLTGLPPINSRLAPCPILFYRINEYSDILKFKRKAAPIQQSVVKKCCEEFQIDEEALIKNLANGDVNNSTTTYFILSNPLFGKPSVPTPKMPQLPPLPKLDAKKRKRTNTIGNSLVAFGTAKQSSSRISVPKAPLNIRHQLSGTLRPTAGTKLIPQPLRTARNV